MNLLDEEDKTYCPKCGEVCTVEIEWEIVPGCASKDYPTPVSSCCGVRLEIPEDF